MANRRPVVGREPNYLNWPGLEPVGPATNPLDAMTFVRGGSTSSVKSALAATKAQQVTLPPLGLPAQSKHAGPPPGPFEKRRVGEVYSTPKGSFYWAGTPGKEWRGDRGTVMSDRDAFAYQSQLKPGEKVAKRELFKKELPNKIPKYMPEYDPNVLYVPEYVNGKWVDNKIKSMSKRTPVEKISSYAKSYHFDRDDLDIKSAPGALVWYYNDGQWKLENRYEKAGNVLYSYVGSIGGIARDDLDFGRMWQSGRFGRDAAEDVPFVQQGYRQAEAARESARSPQNKSRRFGFSPFPGQDGGRRSLRSRASRFAPRNQELCLKLDNLGL